MKRGRGHTGMSDHSLKPWIITGIIATLVTVFSLPLYLLRERALPSIPMNTEPHPSAVFVGSEKCRDCHRREYDKWKGSHHERAMDTAGEKTVLGDFDNAVFRHLGTISRFFRKDGKFYVHTRGPKGGMGDFEITHTFGWFPLQQYLIPFPGGRLQCLPIAWDARDGKWFHLYPDREIDPKDWMYWTNAAQNWNGMCAECHSTNLIKNYDMDSGAYRTTWSEISVGCEACHGPGSRHVAWAEMPEMGRPALDNAAMAVKTRALTSGQQVDLCAPCHSRRMSLTDNIHNNRDFLDYGIPQLLTRGYYHADGQILDEVYVYGSFLQSKMHARGVRCSDCHDVHSIKRVETGNALCLQCHRAALYDTREHHFHKKKGEAGDPVKSAGGDILFEVGSGAQCEQCHMPGRVYMGVDYRPDHSFRIPQPELTRSIGAPNACNRCHVDKDAQWSMDAVKKWYGEKKRPHYGTTLAAGRQGRQDALDGLIALSTDRLYPDIVRATALFLLAAYPGEEGRAACAAGLTDESPLVRHTAVRNLQETDPGRRFKLLGPLLYDPVKAVRIESAVRLAGIPVERMPASLSKKFETVLDEYLKAAERSGDFAASRHNLGNLNAERGDAAGAIAQYLEAIAIDDQFYPAKVNLATLYNRQGDNAAAERLLREVLETEPDLHEAQYSLGLLLAEVEKYQAAETFMSQAARGLPRRGRIHYNLGLLRQRLGRDAGAEAAFQAALGQEPDNPEYLYALAVFYLQRQRLDDATQVATRMAQLPVSRNMGKRLLNSIQQTRDSQKP